MKTIDDVIDAVKNISNKHAGTMVWKTEQVIYLLKKYRDYQETYIDKDIDIYWHRTNPKEDGEYLVEFEDSTHSVINWKNICGWQSNIKVSRWKRIID